MYKFIDGKFYRTEEIQTETILQLLNKFDEFEKKELRLEPHNLWKPTNPIIQIGDEIATETIPQAWEYEGNWYYNWEGAMAEAKYLGKRIPTDEEWTQLLKGKNIKSFIKENNLEPSGYRDTNSNYYTRTYSASLWSSTQVGASSAWQRYFNYSMPSVNRGSNTKAHGFSLRCVQG